MICRRGDRVKKTAFIAGGILLVLILGIGAWIYQSQTLPTAQVRRGAIQEAIYGLGTVRSSQIFEYKHGVTSHIRKIYVTEGQNVKKGDSLLLTEGSSVVQAPFEGTVTSLPFHEDENIFPQVVLVRLENLKTRYIEVNLEQQGVLRVRPGLKARMSFENLRGETYMGNVESLYPLAGQFIVRINSSQLPDEILPGMTVDVAIEVQTKENVLLVPVAALNNGQITIKRNGRKQKLSLKVGLIDGEWAEVLTGDIQESDDVILPRK